MQLQERRKEYDRGGLHESDLNRDPITQFTNWMTQAIDANLLEPYAMTLATATPDGWPSVRIVLLRGVSAEGFTFFTSYDGRKAQELDANPRAALVFYWAELERQVRVEGNVEKTTSEISEAYHRNRPRGSQLAAWASNQSAVLPSRNALEQVWAELEARYQGTEVPLPPFWGGYRVVPLSIEFWQGRPSRMHDRLRYKRIETGWVIERLSP